MIPVAAALACALIAFVVGAIIGGTLTLVFALADELSRHEEPESAWRISQGGGVHASENGR